MSLSLSTQFHVEDIEDRGQSCHRMQWRDLCTFYALWMFVTPDLRACDVCKKPWNERSINHLQGRILHSARYADSVMHRFEGTCKKPHIRELFSEAIDWPLITTHLPDMLRVALSISQGKVRSSTMLRKLGTESRKNKLFVAFRALGRVVRTLFLLRFINDAELRRTINAATNIAEAWNGLIQWVAFGGDGVIRQNNREEQRKIIRYNHLVANLVVFHHVVSMTRVLQALIDEGYPVTPEIIARLAPYKTGHMNRFGHYDLRFDHPPPPITAELRLAPALAVD